MYININTETIATSADQTMMMSPPPPSNESSVIIFDWDDTILPSSFVDRSQSDNLSELPPHTRALFREIEVCTEKCLAAAASYGEVSITSKTNPLKQIPIESYPIFSFVS